MKIRRYLPLRVNLSHSESIQFHHRSVTNILLITMGRHDNELQNISSTQNKCVYTIICMYVFIRSSSYTMNMINIQWTHKFDYNLNKQELEYSS